MERTTDQRPQQFRESDRLIQAMVGKLIEAGLPWEAATQKHVDAVYRHWQMPMYDLDLALIQVSLEDLEAEREASFWAEVGDGPSGY